ncbi:uncharacterized protein G2W53_037167 [Senna tora]|uniref:Uncharacterized protein n=1 Tax=Senna tora TaxID=362788 RepID=A0A834WAW0_9FABA|nr:uncharacterized protein G2W53_037167 [Senna tora]
MHTKNKESKNRESKTAENEADLHSMLQQPSRANPSFPFVPEEGIEASEGGIWEMVVLRTDHTTLRRCLIEATFVPHRLSPFPTSAHLSRVPWNCADA